jgi:hypothetical protein
VLIQPSQFHTCSTSSESVRGDRNTKSCTIAGQSPVAYTIYWQTKGNHNILQSYSNLTNWKMESVCFLPPPFS